MRVVDSAPSPHPKSRHPCLLQLPGRSRRSVRAPQHLAFAPAAVDVPICGHGDPAEFGLPGGRPVPRDLVRHFDSRLSRPIRCPCRLFTSCRPPPVAAITCDGKMYPCQVVVVCKGFRHARLESWRRANGIGLTGGLGRSGGRMPRQYELRHSEALGASVVSRFPLIAPGPIASTVLYRTPQWSRTTAAVGRSREDDEKNSGIAGRGAARNHALA